ncbi:MAG: GntR family transcriptional regulator, partial [Spirochaetia bacterium]|nr:GntR family transcriptional regulator [Spirochaetia bacterium]
MELQANRARDRKREAGAVYERIALDIAKRIERGELSEGVRLSGRTLMSGEYGVSPETIRRSFALLEEMDVVHVMHNSGVLVNSREKAKTFVDKYGKNDASKSLLHRMREILEEHEALNKELYSIAKQLFSLNTRFHEANPFPIHEYM